MSKNLKIRATDKDVFDSGSKILRIMYDNKDFKYRQYFKSLLRSKRINVWDYFERWLK